LFQRGVKKTACRLDEEVNVVSKGFRVQWSKKHVEIDAVCKKQLIEEAVQLCHLTLSNFLYTNSEGIFQFLLNPPKAS